MKILQVVPFLGLGGGLSKYVLTLSGILIEQGHRVGVITTHASDANYQAEELNRCGADNVGALGNDNKLLRYLKCKRLIDKYRPDVLIINYDGTAQFLLPFLSHKPKVVHVIHNDTDDFYRIAAINAGHLDGWIAPTQAVADRFNEYTHGRYASRVKVIAHGVEDAYDKTPRINEKPELIFVGVHYEHKGVKILPPLIKRLIDNGLDFHFTIVGKGILSDWLKDELKTETEKGTVTFTGVIPAGEVYRLQAQADIFIYPTHIDSFGLVIAEAMINGTAPVVTLLPGITDNLIDDGKNGFLLPRDDVDSFAEAVGRLIVNPDALFKIKRAAREKAERCFSLQQMSEHYCKYINSLTK